MRKRAGALILQDKKLLLLSEGGQDFYWTPGGGLEKGEDFLGALKRELKEELNAELKTATLFFSYIDTEQDEEVRYFLTTLVKAPEPIDNKTTLRIYGREDYEQNSVPISKRVYSLVYPRLIAAGLV